MVGEDEQAPLLQVSTVHGSKSLQSELALQPPPPQPGSLGLGSDLHAPPTHWSVVHGSPSWHWKLSVHPPPPPHPGALGFGSWKHTPFWQVPSVQGLGSLQSPSLWHPPFQALVAAVWTPATGLADGPWPRQGRDGQSSQFAGPPAAGVPDLTTLGGWWVSAGAPWRTLYVGKPQQDWTDINTASTAYGLYAANDLGVAKLVERGTIQVLASSAVLQPIWRQDAQPLTTHSRALASGDPWNLQLEDPISGGVVRAWRRVYGLPVPPSPFDATARMTWNSEFLGKAEETVEALTTWSKPGTFLLAGNYQGEGNAFDDPASKGAPCCEAISAFFAGLDVADLNKAWAQYDVATAGNPGKPLRALTDPQGLAVVLSAGGGPAAGAGESVYTIRRFSPDGKTATRHAFAGSAAFPGNVVDGALDKEGGLLAVGTVINQGAIGGDSVGEKGGYTLWVARTGPDESWKWARTVDNPTHWMLPQHAAIDSKGQLWVAGIAQPRVGQQGLTDVLALWTLDSEGKLLNQRLFSGKMAYGETEVHVAVGPQDEVAIFGTFRGTLTLAGKTHATTPDAVGENDGFVVRLNPAGGVLWADFLDGAKIQTATSGVIDSHGVLAIGGILSAELSRPAGQAAVVSQAVYAGYSPCGERIWTRYLEETSDVPGASLYPTVMARDTLDNLWAAARIYGGVRLDGHQLTSLPNQGLNVAVHRLSAPDATALAALAKQTACADLVPPPHHVSVVLSGTGAGRVKSTPAGIDCLGTCAADFAEGVEVELLATAEPGSAFVGWSGGCTGSGKCVIAKGVDAVVKAEFVSPAVKSLVGIGSTGQETIEGLAASGADLLFWGTSLQGSGSSGPADYGAGPVAVYGGMDPVVGKRTGGGQTAWTVAMGGPGMDVGQGVAADGTGGAWLAARIAGVEAQAGTLKATAAAGLDTAMLHVDATGKPLSLSFVASGARLRGNAKGQMALLGSVAAPTTIAGTLVTGGYVLGLTAAGSVAWVVPLPSGENVGFDVGPTGDIAVSYRDSVTDKATVRVITPSGQPLWMWSAPVYPPPTAVVLREDGSVVTLGMYGGQAALAPSLPATPLWAVFSGAGVLVDARSLTASTATIGQLAAMTVATPDGGAIYVSNLNTEIARIGPNGTLKWTAGGFPILGGLAITTGADLWVGGYDIKSVSIPPLQTTVPAQNGTDAWLAQIGL